jgi:hypothetical protein
MVGNRPNKYRAVRTIVDGITFASKAEARRYSELKILEKAGDIKELELQPSYPININDNHICTYRADFRYVDSGGVRVVEDVKGMKTPVYKLKKKLMQAFGVTITEIR